MGLAISHRLMDSMGGRIAVEGRTPARGVAIVISVPSH
jgi:C4-dicarboxylate-specific signal transduction histidine kinase